MKVDSSLGPKKAIYEFLKIIQCLPMVVYIIFLLSWIAHDATTIMILWRYSGKVWWFSRLDKAQFLHNQDINLWTSHDAQQRFFHIPLHIGLGL